jgi:cytochrome c biogenesis protein CcmG, thiol:disulfide interchange protein DsbE
MSAPSPAPPPGRASTTSEADEKRTTPAWRRALQVVAVTLVAALFGLFVWKLITEDEGRTLVASVKAGRAPAAPRFELPVIWTETDTWAASVRPVIGDGRLALAELSGHPVAVNFWASWCIPCKEEAPLLEASARSHRGRVLFLGIDVQDLRSDARRFLRAIKPNYPSVRDPDGGTYSDFGLTGVPETYYLDSRHRVVAHTVGQVSRSELEAGIARATAGSRP